MDEFHYSVFTFQYTTYLVQLLLSIIPEPRAKLKSDRESVEHESEHKVVLCLINNYYLTFTTYLIFSVSEGLLQRMMPHSSPSSHGGGRMVKFGMAGGIHLPVMICMI